MKLTETLIKKLGYRRWRILFFIVAIALVVSLISLLVVMPKLFGERFFSLSHELEYVVSPDFPAGMEVKLKGSVVRVREIGLWANVVNRHIVPVEVGYDGFDFVWFVYNQTVADPKDVLGNLDYLVWGAFRAAYDIDGYSWFGFSMGGDFWKQKIGAQTGYEYYAIHKDRSNFTMMIPVGTKRHHLAPPHAWYGQNLYGQPVPPGTYYVYCIAYGKVNKPIDLTVTSILWWSAGT